MAPYQDESVVQQQEETNAEEEPTTHTETTVQGEVISSHIDENNDQLAETDQEAQELKKSGFKASIQNFGVKVREKTASVRENSAARNDAFRKSVKAKADAVVKKLSVRSKGGKGL